MDPLTEKTVMDNLGRKSCTCVIIAHRLSAIRDCDRILVLDGGHIAEEGTHGSLMEQNGLYASLYSSARGGELPS